MVLVRVLIFIFLIIGITSSVRSDTDNQVNLLTSNFTQADLQNSLLKSQKWIPYPTYSDRAGWDKLTKTNKLIIISQGENFLDYKWQVIKATDYLAYERNGSRVIMEKPMGENAEALSSLFYAELAEGKGRFLDQIINAVWYFSEMNTWSLSAHVGPYQSSKRSLPQMDTHVVDLMAGDLGSFLSWVHYFLREEMDKVNPEIALRLKHNLKKRIIDPYMQRNDMWWQALEMSSNKMVNNWNPWCNFNVLTCLLLVEDNDKLRVEGIYKTMNSVDKFINYVKHDGACEEGPSYWGHAAGKLFDYLHILALATGGKINLFDQKVIKDMGEYISQSYIGGDSWVVNFADASAKGGGDPFLIYRYGNSVKSNEMKHFAKYLFDKKNYKITVSKDAYRSLENLKTFFFLQEETGVLPSNSHKWYQQTEFLYIRDKKYFFAAKGGFNNESHNHNDIGTFILYLDHNPVFIDAGVGTYNQKTFSKERYEIWTMQSRFHNLPTINGFDQLYGNDYRSKDVKFDENKLEFELNLVDAYPDNSGINSWIRKYRVINNGLVITDQFDIKKPTEKNIIHFMLADEPKLINNSISLNNGAYTLTFDFKDFDVEIGAIEQDDLKLKNVWGEKIYRLSFKAKNIVKKASYTFVVK